MKCFPFLCCQKAHIQWEDTTEFVVPITEGQVIKVYDGDTITVASKLPYKGSPLYRFSVRLAGIDTPEMTSSEDTTKDRAILAKNSLTNLVLNKKVYLKNVKNEKYGRILANVFVDGVHVNQWMLTHKHAVTYNGGKKDQ